MNIDKEKQNNIDWWNSLSLRWKSYLIKSLKDDYNSWGVDAANTYQPNIDWFNKSTFEVSDVLDIKKLEIPYRLAVDLSPVFKLKKLDDFYIIPIEKRFPPVFDTDFINIYPKQLRDKVKRLDFYLPGYFDGSLYSLKDFVNLESINFQHCGIGTLDGIENLKNLTSVTIDQGNYISDLSPLKNSKITYLDVNYTDVSDLSPLKGLKLEYLNIEHTQVTDLSPLSDMKTLERLDSDNVDRSPIYGLPHFPHRSGETELPSDEIELPSDDFELPSDDLPF